MLIKRIIFILLFISAIISNAALYNLGGFWKGTGGPAGQWTWMTGTRNATDEYPVYGTQGVAAATNTPGGREDSLTWTDSSGNLWLYGGNGIDINGDYGFLNELWKYDISTNQWAWILGSGALNASPVYGTKGTAAAGNTPGARRAGMTWFDSTGSGFLWFFGGQGSGGYYNDIWKYSISSGQWTWVHGPNYANGGADLGSFGVPSTTNNPSSRSGGAHWLDGSGNFWIFGGQIFGSYYNDTWRYNPSTDEWTWLKGDSNSGIPTPTYGTKGTEAAGNVPSGREYAQGWIDGSGNMWIFGGYGRDSNGNEGKLSEIWRFNPSNQRWTWMVGSNVNNERSIPGTQNVASTSNVIGARHGHTLWKDTSNDVWIFGGTTAGVTCDWETNDLWRFNSTTLEVTWIKGDPDCQNPAGSPGTKGTSSGTNLPSTRIPYSTFWQDGSNNFYFYGGRGYDSNRTGGINSDMWRFNTGTGNWTWIGGSTVIPTKTGIYGTQGTSSATNEPGSRGGLGAVVDDNGNQFIFGGRFGGMYYDCFGCGYNTMMKFTPSNNHWTWVHGTPGVNDTNLTVFGTKGTPHANNSPGNLMGHGMTIDTSTGMIWVFGGQSGFNSSPTNNLWMFNPTTSQWTWVHGPGASYLDPGVYGTKGTPHANNIPGARREMVFTADRSGNLWLFAGRGADESGGEGMLSDLWKYNISLGQWTWMAGPKVHSQNGVYGTKGTPNASNTPGGRQYSAGFIDTYGNFYIYGGNGYDSVNGYNEALNDTWKFDTTTNQWTWVHGPSTSSGGNAAVVYGSIGVPNAANNPGGRDNMVGFSSPTGTNLYVGAGWANDTAGGGSYNGSVSIFRYDPINNQWACLTACNDSYLNQAPVYGTKGTPAPTNYPKSFSNGAGAIDRFGTIWIHGGSFGSDTQHWRFK